MNAKAVKAERRQIRRVLGDDAAQSLAVVLNDLKAQRLKLNDLTARVQQEHNNLVDAAMRFENFKDRDGRGRLRWLLRGR